MRHGFTQESYMIWFTFLKIAIAIVCIIMQKMNRKSNQIIAVVQEKDCYLDEGRINRDGEI